jgi:hypothetical protein
MEKILCSAIWYKELPTPVFRPINVDKGIVFCGLRHVFCLHQMVSMTGKKQNEVGHYVQGFLTDKNRFVDRKEAARIAIESHQIEKLDHFKNELDSSDIFK